MTDQTTTTPETQSGTCACGAPVTRPILPGRLGEALARTPFCCNPCVQRDDEDRQRADDAQFYRDLEIRREQQLLSGSDLPAKFHEVDLNDMSLERPWTAAARRWVDQQPKSRRSSFLDDDPPSWWNGPADRAGLVLSGPVGVGKTHLAAGTARALIRQGTRVRWLTGPLLFARLGTGFGHPDHDRIIKTLTSNVALVLDDLDKTRPTAYGAENVFLAIDSRVTNVVPLLVTTNLSIAELAQHWPEPWGEAIASRLAGYCEIVRMNGPDRRTAA